MDVLVIEGAVPLIAALKALEENCAECESRECPARLSSAVFEQWF